MKTRIGGKRTGKRKDKCVIGTCRTPLHMKVVYEWNWFIQDSTSPFDGEEHHITLCSRCYEKLEQQFVGHVVASNEMDAYVAYGGTVEELDKREQERLHRRYRKGRLSTQN